MNTKFKETLGNVGMGLLTGVVITTAALGAVGIEYTYSNFISEVNNIIDEINYKHPVSRVTLSNVSRGNIHDDHTPDNHMINILSQLSFYVAITTDVTTKRKIVDVLMKSNSVFPKTNMFSYSELESLRQAASKRF